MPPRAPTTPSSSGPAPGLGPWEEELEGLKQRLAQDLSVPGAESALYRLMAITAASNLELNGRRSRRAPPPRKARGPVPATAAWTATPGGDRGDLAGRLEAIASSIHALLVTIAARLGATGYSIGVSLPAGLSLTVDFSIPGPPRGGPPNPVGAAPKA